MSPAKVPVLQVPRQSYQLRCGARLLVSPRPGAPVTAVRFHVRGGKALDPEGKEGLAFLTGRLTDQGSSNLDESALAAEIEPAGGEIQGDAHGLTGSIAGDSWKLLLDLMGELFTDAAYPAGPVAIQRTRLANRLAVQEDDPRAVGSQIFRGLVYGDHYLGRDEYGTAASIAAITPKELRTHRKKNWVAERLWVAVCGDVDPEKVRRHLDRVLKDVPKGKPFERPSDRFPKEATRVAAFTKRREQVHVYLGHLGVKRSTPDWEPIVVMDYVLGSGPGFTNRVSRILRDELGLAYSVHANLHSSAGLSRGVFGAYIGTSPEHVGTAVAGFLQEIRRIREELVGADELKLVKDYLLGSSALGYERASRRARYLIQAESLGYPEDHLERMREAYAKVTAEQVREAARTHLRPDTSCLAAAGPVTKKELRAMLG